MAVGWLQYLEYSAFLLLNCVLAVVNNAAIFPTQPSLPEYPPKFNFTINQPRACDDRLFLVVFVTSTVQHAEERQAIRDTWANKNLQKNHHMKVLFLVGTESDKLWPAGFKETITHESHTYQDIVQVQSPDSYPYLTMKSIAMLQWMDTYCKKAHFLFKTDDDMFINIENLLKDLYNSVHEQFVMGHIISGAKPIRDKTSKYYTPESLYKNSTYPNYLSGTGYVVSGDLVHDLYTITLQTPIFWMEDVYITGFCAQSVNANYIFNGKFGYMKREYDPCVYKDIITGHELNGSQIRTMWRLIHNPHLDCNLPPIEYYDD